MKDLIVTNKFGERVYIRWAAVTQIFLDQKVKNENTGEREPAIIFSLTSVAEGVYHGSSGDIVTVVGEQAIKVLNYILQSQTTDYVDFTSQ